MSKYTPANALAIKRDIQRSQTQLKFIADEIVKKTEELASVVTSVVAQRNILSNFNNRVATFFQRKNNEIVSLSKQEKNKEKLISNLETTINELILAKDLLATQVLLQKEQIEEPKSAIFIGSVIEKLGHTLDGLLSKIDASEAELDKLEKQRKEFIVGNKELATDIERQESVVHIAQLEMQEIEEKREDTLRHLAREKNKLTQIRAREHDSKVMEGRLSKEYQEVYKNMPKRGNK